MSNTSVGFAETDIDVNATVCVDASDATDSLECLFATAVLTVDELSKLDTAYFVPKKRPSVNKVTNGVVDDMFYKNADCDMQQLCGAS